MEGGRTIQDQLLVGGGVEGGRLCSGGVAVTWCMMPGTRNSIVEVDVKCGEVNLIYPRPKRSGGSTLQDQLLVGGGRGRSTLFRGGGGGEDKA